MQAALNVHREVMPACARQPADCNGFERSGVVRLSAPLPRAGPNHSRSVPRQTPRQWRPRRSTPSRASSATNRAPATSDCIVGDPDRDTEVLDPLSSADDPGGYALRSLRVGAPPAAHAMRHVLYATHGGLEATRRDRPATHHWVGSEERQLQRDEARAASDKAPIVPSDARSTSDGARRVRFEAPPGSNGPALLRDPLRAGAHKARPAREARLVGSDDAWHLRSRARPASDQPRFVRYMARFASYGNSSCALRGEARSWGTRRVRHEPRSVGSRRAPVGHRSRSVRSEQRLARYGSPFASTLRLREHGAPVARLSTPSRRSRCLRPFRDFPH